MPRLIWPSQRIARAIGDGLIQPGLPLDDDQLQPASLDLRLGARAFRLPASFLPGPGRTIAERLADLSTHEVDLTTPTVLERNCVHIVPLLESLRLPPGVSARANPKSSSGRLDIFVRVIVDGGATFDEIPDGYRGPLYAEVVPRSFPILAVAGTRLAQMRFREPGNGAGPRLVPVTIDLDPEGKPGGIVGCRARKTAGLIDIAKVDAYPRDAFWEALTAPSGAANSCSTRTNTSWHRSRRSPLERRKQRRWSPTTPRSANCARITRAFSIRASIWPRRGEPVAGSCSR